MNKEEYEKMEKNADFLEKNACIKCNSEVLKAQSLNKGNQKR